MPTDASSTEAPAAAAEGALTGDDVVHLARLARIDLTADERDRLAGQLSRILEAVARVGEVAGPDVPATSHPLPLVNVWRPDDPRPGLALPDALSGAPAAEADRFRVPRILEED
ncbi:MAG: Asp-tRNA(Asn)/Glu-tRNA(Gln) amidotransferase subunit GatC [Kineosporiaceae bacterium]